MSRWRNNGGWNKTHGTVEKVPRIDSYEAGAVGGWGTMFGYTDKGIPLVFDCVREIEYLPDRDLETVTLWHKKDGWSETLELSRKANGFGGSQAFFLCPACGERRRYLYQVGITFLCRKCSGLNYRSQQETRSGSMYYYDKGMAGRQAPGHMAQGTPGWVQLLRMDSRKTPVYAPGHIQSLSAAVFQVPGATPDQRDGGHDADTADAQVKPRYSGGIYGEREPGVNLPRPFAYIPNKSACVPVR